MTKFVQLLHLNLLWVLFSLPLFTIGAATAALHAVTLRMVRNEEGYIFQNFWAAFRKNFRQATGLGLFMTVAFAILIGDIVFFFNWNSWVGVVGAGVFLVGFLLFGLTAMFLFHVQAHFHNTMKNTFVNAFKMALRHLPSSGALLILCGCMVYGLSVNVPLMVIEVLIGVPLFSYVSSFLLRQIFSKHYELEAKERTE